MNRLRTTDLVDYERLPSEWLGGGVVAVRDTAINTLYALSDRADFPRTGETSRIKNHPLPYPMRPAQLALAHAVSLDDTLRGLRLAGRSHARRAREMSDRANDWFSALPFATAERDVLVNVQRSLQKTRLHELADALVDTEPFEIMSQGRFTVVDGAELVDRWDDWSTASGPYADGRALLAGKWALHDLVVSLDWLHGGTEAAEPTLPDDPLHRVTLPPRE